MNMAGALSEADIERMCRSVATLSPRYPAALDRETALELLTELQHLLRKDRRVRHLVRQVSGLLEEAEEAQGS